MEFKERGETELIEAVPSKLSMAIGALKEGRSLLGNVNNLDGGEDDENGSSGQGVESFLSPKQQRAWKNLSNKRKERYLKKGKRRALNDAPQKIQEVSAGTQKDSTVFIGEHSKKQGIAQTISNSAGKTAGKGAASGAGAAATGGVALAGEAAKKVADQFREALTRRVALHMEETSQSKKVVKETSVNKKKGESSGGFLLVIVGAFVGMFLLLMMPILVFVMGAAGYEAQSMELVAVAQRELEASEFNIGGTKYKEWYGTDGDWCMMFISWCANECGYLEKNILVRSASVHETKVWFEEQDLYHSKESGYVPKEGDFIFFLNGMSHVGIVESYDSATDQITTIEGNSGSSGTIPYHAGSRVMRNVYQRGAASISGYASPDYPAIEITDDSEEVVE